MARRIRPPRRGDDGAVLVEFALVVPLLVVLVIGLLEFGFAWRQNLYVERAVQSAGRTGASSGADLFTDFDILQSVSSSISGAENLELTKVIVFKANTATEVPAACLSVNAAGTNAKGVSGVCNVYGPAQVNTSSPGIGFPRTLNATTCPGGSWDAFWCPMSREREVGLADRVGVYVEVEYESLTNILPAGSRTFTATAIYQIEPTYVGR